jgi:hypothetical protein
LSGDGLSLADGAELIDGDAIATTAGLAELVASAMRPPAAKPPRRRPM